MPASAPAFFLAPPRPSSAAASSSTRASSARNDDVRALKFYAIAQRDRLVASACSNSSVVVHDLTTPATSSPANTAAFSGPAAARDPTLPLPAIPVLRTLTGHTTWANDVAFSHPSSSSFLLASGDASGEVIVWDVERDFARVGQLPREEHGSAEVLSVSFGSTSATGNMLAVCAERRCTLWTWALGKTAAGPLIWSKTHVLPTLKGKATTAAFAPDGERLAVASSRGELVLYNPQSGECVQQLLGDSMRHSAWLHDVVWTPDGREVFAASRDQHVHFVSAASPPAYKPAKHKVHRSTVYSLALSADGERLLTCSDSSSVALWAVRRQTPTTAPTLRRLERMPHTTSAQWSCTFASSDSNLPYALSAANFAKLHVWDLLALSLEKGDLAEVFRLVGAGGAASTSPSSINHPLDAAGNTALHLALLRHRNPELVRFLLDHGADQAATNAAGVPATATSALQALIPAGLPDNAWLAFLLTELNADPNVKDPASGNTALHAAAQTGNETAFRLLVQACANINAVNKNRKRALDLMTDSHKLYTFKEIAGQRDVFISYAHVDQEVVLRVRALLEKQKITTWLDLMDPAGIEAGTVWRDEIARAISRATVLVAMVSEPYLGSTWCTNEVALARQHGVEVVPVMLEKVAIPEDTRMHLYPKQFAPLHTAVRITAPPPVPAAAASTGNAPRPRAPRRFTITDEHEFEMRCVQLADGLKKCIEARRQADKTEEQGESAPTTVASSEGGTPAASPSTMPVASTAPTVQTVPGAATLAEAGSNPFAYIAHGQEHLGVVTEMVSQLRSAGILAVVAPYSTDSSRYTAARDAIRSCAVFVAVLSNKSAKTQEVRDHMAFAEDKRKPLLPVYVGSSSAPWSVDVPPGYRYQLAQSPGLAHVNGRWFVERSLPECVASILTSNSGGGRSGPAAPAAVISPAAAPLSPSSTGSAGGAGTSLSKAPMSVSPPPSPLADKKQKPSSAPTSRSRRGKDASPGGRSGGGHGGRWGRAGSTIAELREEEMMLLARLAAVRSRRARLLRQSGGSDGAAVCAADGDNDHASSNICSVS